MEDMEKEFVRVCDCTVYRIWGFPHSVNTNGYLSKSNVCKKKKKSCRSPFTLRFLSFLLIVDFFFLLLVSLEGIIAYASSFFKKKKKITGKLMLQANYAFKNNHKKESYKPTQRISTFWCWCHMYKALNSINNSCAVGIALHKGTGLIDQMGPLFIKFIFLIFKWTPIITLLLVLKLS